MNITADQYWELSPNTGYFEHTTNIGVIHDGNKIYLVDSGNNPEEGKDIVNALQELFPEKKICGIFNTHSHADHAGGNSGIIELTDAKVYAPSIESSIIESPETLGFLYKGSLPFSDLQKIAYNDIFPSKVDRILANDETLDFENVSIKVIPLPGHYFNHAGFLVKDKQENKKSFFLGDGFFGVKMLKKYWIPYMINPKKFRESIKTIANSESDFYVPAHGEVSTSNNIMEVAEFNYVVTLETEILIQKLLKNGPLSEELIVKQAADYAKLNLKLGQYILISSTLRSYMASLCDEGKITYTVEDNILKWKLA